MKKCLYAACAAAIAFAVPATPVAAQESSYTPGSYWDVSMIDIEDGQEENYLDFLADQFKKGQEFAKSKGYIQEYHVLSNSYPRPGEPDIYLVTKYTKQYDTAEQLRQQKEYEAFMKKDTRVLTAESGARVKYRKLMGNMQLRELNLK